MRAIRLVLAVAVGAVGVLGVASPAAADSSVCSKTGCAGKAAFVSYGEHLKVTDQTGDGHSAVAEYWLEGGTGPFQVWNPNGTGTTVDANLELVEGDWIFYHVCTGEYGSKTIVAGSCGAGVTDYA